MNDYVHKVGKRKVKAISFHATKENFLEGCRFNDSLGALSPGRKIHIAKGVYFFQTHQEADRQRENWLVKGIASAVGQR